MNISFQMLNVKTRLAVGILYKAAHDVTFGHEFTIIPECRVASWEEIAEFYDRNYSNFSEQKIMEILKIAKRNGFKAHMGAWSKTEVPASQVIASVKWFDSSNTYEFELKQNDDFAKAFKIARYAVLVGGMFLGVQLPMGDA